MAPDDEPITFKSQKRVKNEPWDQFNCFLAIVEKKFKSHVEDDSFHKFLGRTSYQAICVGRKIHFYVKKWLGHF